MVDTTTPKERGYSIGMFFMRLHKVDAEIDAPVDIDVVVGGGMAIVAFIVAAIFNTDAVRLAILPFFLVAWVDQYSTVLVLCV